MMSSSYGVRDLISNLYSVNETEISFQDARGHSSALGELENNVSVDLVKTFEHINRSPSALNP